MYTSELPCRRDCPDRFPGCHSSCKKYIEAKEKRDAKIAAVRAKREAEVAVNNYVASRVSEATGKPLKSR